MCLKTFPLSSENVTYYVDLLETYLRNVAQEPDVGLRLAQLQSLVSTEAYQVLEDQKCLATIFSLLQDTYRIRELSLKLLISIFLSNANPSIQREISLHVNSILNTMETCSYQNAHVGQPKVVQKIMDAAEIVRAGVAIMSKQTTKRLIVALCAVLGHLASKQGNERCLSCVFTCIRNLVDHVLRKDELLVQENKVEIQQLFVAVLESINRVGAPIVIRFCAVQALLSLSYVCLFTCVSHQQQVRLVGALSEIFTKSQNSEGSGDILRMYGALGALDPEIVEQHNSAVSAVEYTAELPEQDQELLLLFDTDEKSHFDRHYTLVVYRFLVSLLEPGSDVSLLATRTLLQVLKRSPNTPPNVALVKLAALALKYDDDRFAEPKKDCILAISAINNLSTSISPTVLMEINKMIAKSWMPSRPWFSSLLSLLQSLNGAIFRQDTSDSSPVWDAVERDWAWLYPKVVSTLETNPKDFKIAAELVQIFPLDAIIPSEHLLLLVPCIIALINKPNAPPLLRCDAASLAISLITKNAQSRHIHALLQALRTITQQLSSDSALARDFTKVVQPLLKKLHEAFPVSGATVKRAISECNVAGGDIHANTPSNAPSDPSVANVNVPLTDEVNLGSLLQHVEKAASTQLAGNLNFQQWWAELQRLVFVYSPHNAFQQCVALYDKYDPLKRELFDSALHCAYSRMSNSEQELVQAALKRAMHSGIAEVESGCLSFADALEHVVEARGRLRPQVGGGMRRYARLSNMVDCNSQAGSSFPTSFPSSLQPAPAAHHSVQESTRTQMSTIDEAVRWATLTRMLNSCANEPPTDIQESIINLAYTLSQKNFFSILELAEAAQRNGMHAKGIRFGEMLYAHAESNEQRAGTANVLAQLYNAMGMRPSVIGCLESTATDPAVTDPLWFELLHMWPQAINSYRAHLAKISTGSDTALTAGLVRSLCYSANFAGVLEISRTATPQILEQVFPHAAVSAWMLQQWGTLSELCDRSPPSPFRCLLKHVAQYAPSQGGAVCTTLIDDGRKLVESSLRSLLPVGYSHAYDSIVMLQHFVEADEALSIISEPKTTRRATIRTEWLGRFQKLKPDAVTMLVALGLRSVVFKPLEIAECWLRFADQMRTSYPGLSQWAIDALHSDSATTGNPIPAGSSESTIDALNNAGVAIAYMQHLWNKDRSTACQLFARYLDHQGPQLSVSSPQMYGEAHLQLGKWKQELNTNFWQAQYRENLLRHLQESVNALPYSYQAWHEWGLLNYRIQQRDASLKSNPQLRRIYVRKAHQGFVCAICNSASVTTSLQDALRLLQLWVFNEGTSELEEEVGDAVFRIAVEHWLNVIPQLIAHLGTANTTVRRAVTSIVSRVCSTHPQAVVFPLCVSAGDTQGGSRTECAKLILDTCCPLEILREARLVIRGLVDVAATEQETLRELISKPLLLLQDPHTTPDQSVLETHIRNIQDFLKSRSSLVKCCRFSGDLGEDLDRIYHILDNDIRVQSHAQLPVELASGRALALYVPGEYSPSNSVASPTIASFQDQLEIIPSQHRPRKLNILGSDGLEYLYLLKGHEDTRMDERVMQLFGLVNALMKQDQQSLSITLFSVIPLSSNVGLSRWVNHTETLHAIITQHRSSFCAVDDLENNVLQSEVIGIDCPRPGDEFDKLCLPQKVELFEYVLRKSGSVDLANMMWLRAPSADLWLQRRTTYTKSHALMSMVGYILGLGDRHLGNLLMHTSGKIIHVDFGDCFDVARFRQRCPETVPFRLTRMLVNAMEVFGVNGIFRSSSVAALSTLRSNRDSIMALLSAFIYDPIVNLHLVGSPEESVERVRSKLRGTEIRGTLMALQ